MFYYYELLIIKLGNTVCRLRFGLCGKGGHEGQNQENESHDYLFLKSGCK